jgi:hypothetical protein
VRHAGEQRQRAALFRGQVGSRGGAAMRAAISDNESFGGDGRLADTVLKNRSERAISLPNTWRDCEPDTSGGPHRFDRLQCPHSRTCERKRRNKSLSHGLFCPA